MGREKMDTTIGGDIYLSSRLFSLFNCVCVVVVVVVVVSLSCEAKFKLVGEAAATCKTFRNLEKDDDDASRSR